MRSALLWAVNSSHPKVTAQPTRLSNPYHGKHAPQRDSPHLPTGRWGGFFRS